MNTTDSIIDSELLGDFVEEAREHLSTIGDGLLQMEHGVDDPEVINAVFRSLHTIKGVSSFVGLTDINGLSHAGENVLDEIRDGNIQPSSEVIDALLETCDLLSDLVDMVANDQAGGGPNPQVDTMTRRLHAMLDQPTADSSPAPTAATAVTPTDSAAAPPANGSVARPEWPAPGTNLAPELVAQFITEATDHLEELEQSLLELEKTPTDSEHINKAFRAIHSVKGTADYVGLAQIKTFSHHLESVFQLLRSHQLAIDTDVSELILQGADALRSMVSQLQPDAEIDHDLGELVARLNAVVQAESEGEPVATPSADRGRADNAPLAIFAQSAEQYIESVRLQTTKLIDLGVSDSVVQTLRRTLETLRNSAAYMERDEFVEPCDSLSDLLENLSPTVDALDDTTRQRVVNIRTRLEALFDQVRQDLEEPEVAPVVADTRAPDTSDSGTPQPAKENTASSKKTAAKTMRVDQDKLDDYVNLAGELVIARNSLTHAFRALETVEPHGLRAMKSALDGLERIVGMIQNNAMTMRMVPVKTVFQRFPRVVRDIAKSQGKKIELRIFGEDTEIDKQVAEALGDPLVHLVRNSADHGIEAPDVRVAAGKSETGLITLKADREGSFIVIDIIDDGAGIDVQRLKAKAVENGVITPEQATTMADDEALKLIFAPGLSTAKAITDVSGRGVGMDVVRTNIANLGGSVSVASELGTGAHLRIYLPLTLAVTTALLVDAGGQTYAVPIESVSETVKVLPDQIKTLSRQWAITLRGSIIPLTSLSQLLGQNEANSNGSAVQTADETPAVDATGRVPVVVVNAGGRQFGLVVDTMLGQHEIVLKPLPEYLAALPGLGSATVMGDGTIVLILDPASLYSAALAMGENNDEQ